METQDMLSSLLSDPEKLQQALSMASSFLGGDTNNQDGQNMQNEQEVQNTSYQMPNFDDPSMMLMQKAMPVISQIAQSGHGAVSYEKRQLLQAVKPFVSEPIQSQIDHAIRLVGMAKMAKTALHQLDGKNSGGLTDV